MLTLNKPVLFVLRFGECSVLPPTEMLLCWASLLCQPFRRSLTQDVALHPRKHSQYSANRYTGRPLYVFSLIQRYVNTATTPSLQAISGTFIYCSSTCGAGASLHSSLTNELNGQATKLYGRGQL